MRKYGIIANLEKRESLRQALRIARWLEKNGAGVDFEESLARKLGRTGFSWSSLPADLRALLVLGGDGTMISTFHHLGRRDLPLLGINLGGLGFLTTFPLENLLAFLRQLLADQLGEVSIATLRCSVIRRGRTIKRFDVINEVVIGKGGLARVIQLDTRVDGEYLTSYLADGLILATPCGSTAYSLSAFGPIIGPQTRALLITPICPHTLTNRPIILSARQVIEVNLISNDPDTHLTIDGQLGIPLEAGDLIRVTGSPRKLRLITPANFSYYRILRSKLNWGGSSHYRAFSSGKKK